jgi:hypothetical protein
MVVANPIIILFSNRQKTIWHSGPVKEIFVKNNCSEELLHRALVQAPVHVPRFGPPVGRRKLKSINLLRSYLDKNITQSVKKKKVCLDIPSVHT